MSLKLAARLVVFPPYKIGDLQENDTALHELDLSAILPEDCKAVLIRALRISGTGVFVVYPVSGSTGIYAGDSSAFSSVTLLPVKNRIIMWKNTAANDDWDLTLFGYFVQRRTD